MQKGWWCRKCDSVKSLHQKDCRCMVHLPETECAKHRGRYWYPLRVEVEVTMEGANRA